MATNKPTSAQKVATAPLSFEDAHGATVTIPPGKAETYAGVRAEELIALAQLLSAAALGHIVLSPFAIQSFQLMANERAHALKSLIGLVADDADSSSKWSA